MLFYTACEAAGASSARSSLRPFIERAKRNEQLAQKACGEIAEVCPAVEAIPAVIARSSCGEAIHLSVCRAMDCFASLAMTGIRLVEIRICRVGKGAIVPCPPCHRMIKMVGSARFAQPSLRPSTAHPAALLFIAVWSLSLNSASSSAARSETAQKFKPPSLQLRMLKPWKLSAFAARGSEEEVCATNRLTTCR